MDDLIKRSDAIEAIEVVDWYHQNRNKDMVSGANSAEHQAWYKADDVYKALEALLSADRPQGHYIKGENGEWYCSNCKRIDDKYSVARFCWHCGARMKGADNEGYDI